MSQIPSVSELKYEPKGYIQKTWDAKRQSHQTAPDNDLAMEMLSAMLGSAAEECKVMSCLAAMADEKEMKERLLKAAEVFSGLRSTVEKKRVVK